MRLGPELYARDMKSPLKRTENVLFVMSDLTGSTLVCKERESQNNLENFLIGAEFPICGGWGVGEEGR